MRGGLSRRHCEEPLRRSNPESLRGGSLDCFASLAMTEIDARASLFPLHLACRHALSFSRLVLPELCLVSPPTQSQEGAGKTGCRQAPAVRCAKCTRRKTAQQHTGGADHSAFPARWSDGLCRDLPGAELSFWPPSPRELDDAVCPVGLARIFARLDRSNDGQDHTVLPYARPALSPQYSRPCTRNRKLTGETKPSSAVRLHAGVELTGTTRPARPISCRRCRVHRKPGSRSRRPRDRPSSVSRDGQHIRQNLISVKWNIFAAGA